MLNLLKFLIVKIRSILDSKRYPFLDNLLEIIFVVLSGVAIIKKILSLFSFLVLLISFLKFLQVNLFNGHLFAMFLIMDFSGCLSHFLLFFTQISSVSLMDFLINSLYFVYLFVAYKCGAFSSFNYDLLIPKFLHPQLSVKNPSVSEKTDWRKENALELSKMPLIAFTEGYYYENALYHVYLVAQYREDLLDCYSQVDQARSLTPEEKLRWHKNLDVWRYEFSRVEKRGNFKEIRTFVREHFVPYSSISVAPKVDLHMVHRKVPFAYPFQFVYPRWRNEIGKRLHRELNIPFEPEIP